MNNRVCGEVPQIHTHNAIAFLLFGPIQADATLELGQNLLFLMSIMFNIFRQNLGNPQVNIPPYAFE